MDKPIVLTDEEREALVCAQKLMEKAAYLHECQGAEQASVLVRYAKTLENLLARSGAEEGK